MCGGLYAMNCMHAVLMWLFPFCLSANDCGKLRIPQNGSLLGNKTTFPNFVTFSCDEGFILKGSKVRHCQANKAWTGEVTYCDGKWETLHKSNIPLN